MKVILRADDPIEFRKFGSYVMDILERGGYDGCPVFTSTGAEFPATSDNVGLVQEVLAREGRVEVIR